MLFHTAGIVLLTLVINGTTLQFLLDMLGLRDISHARKLALIAATRRIDEARVKATKILKSDKFLVDSHWEVVAQRTVLHFPVVDDLDEDVEVIAGSGFLPRPVKDSSCPSCKVHVPHVLMPKEKAEFEEDLRQRLIRAEKTSYWKQYRQGLLDEDAVLILFNIADNTLDIPGKMLEIEDVEKYWKSPKYLLFMRRWLRKVLDIKYHMPLPRSNIYLSEVAYRVVSNSCLEWLLFLVLLLDLAYSVTYLSITNATAVAMLNYVNYVFVMVYMTEASLKLIGYRQYYFTRLWNLYDLLVLFLSLADIYLSISFSGPHQYISGVRLLRALRFLHSLKLIKLVVLVILRIVNDILDRSLRLGYGLGKGFVLGKEEVLKQFFSSSCNSVDDITSRMKQDVEKSRLDVLKSLYEMQREHPKVAQSLKTRQAIRVILNHCSSTVDELKSAGMLEELDANMLTLAIEMKLKHLQRSFHQLVNPPNPLTVLVAHPLLFGLEEELVLELLQSGQQREYGPGDVLQEHDDENTSLFIIIEGLVKITSYTLHEDETAATNTEDGRERESFSDTTFSGVSLIPNIQHSVTMDNCSSNNMSFMTPLSSPITSPSCPPPPLNSPQTMSIKSKKWIVVDSSKFLSVGQVLGDVAVLEGGSADYQAVCETGVKVFSIHKLEVQRLMRQNPVLEERLWKHRSIHVAIMLLERLLEYKDLSEGDLLMLLYEKAFMAHLIRVSDDRNLEVPRHWKHVVLVSGEVSCKETNEKFTAPCIISRNVQILKIPRKPPKILIVSSVKAPHRDSAFQRYHKEDSVVTGIAKVYTEAHLRGSWSVSQNWLSYSKELLKHYVGRLWSLRQRVQMEFQEAFEDPKSTSEFSDLDVHKLPRRKARNSSRISFDLTMPFESVSRHIISAESAINLQKINSDAVKLSHNGSVLNNTEFLLKQVIHELSKSKNADCETSTNVLPVCYDPVEAIDILMVDEVSQINIIPETDDSASEQDVHKGGTDSTSSSTSGIDRLELPKRPFHAWNTGTLGKTRRQPIRRSTSDWSQQSTSTKHTLSGSNTMEAEVDEDEFKIIRPRDHRRARSEPMVNPSEKLRVRFKDYPSDEDHRMS